MKVPTSNIGGEIVKDNETYLLRDNKLLKNLVLSSTLLLPEKETRGHSHDGQEEVYFFQYGYGEMTLGEETFPVSGGETVLIPDGPRRRAVAHPWRAGTTSNRPGRPSSVKTAPNTSSPPSRPEPSRPASALA